MSLKYYLIESSLPNSAAQEKSARITSNGTYTTMDIINRISNKNSKISKYDLMLYLEYYHNEIRELIEDGNKIQFPFGTTQFSMKGKFENSRDSFDPKRHKLSLSFRTSKEFQRMCKKIPLEKVENHSVGVIIEDVKDCYSKKYNRYITSKCAVQILGSNLKVGGDLYDTGIYFISEDSTRCYKVTTIFENKRSRLLFLAPELEPGFWRIYIKTQIDLNGRVSKVLRRGDSSFAFEVLESE